jgi:hypothetical protein
LYQPQSCHLALMPLKQGSILRINLCVCVCVCVCEMLGIKPRALCMLGKHSPTELHSNPSFFFLCWFLGLGWGFLVALSDSVLLCSPAGLKLMILWPLPLKCRDYRDYRYLSPYLVLHSFLNYSSNLHFHSSYIIVFSQGYHWFHFSKSKHNFLDFILFNLSAVFDSITAPKLFFANGFQDITYSPSFCPAFLVHLR